MNKLALAAFATLAISGAAMADTYPYNVSVRGGVVFPIDKSYSNISSTFFGVGVDIALNKSLFKGGETFISVDYQSKTLGRDKGSVFPIMLNQKFWGAGKLNGTRTYTILGLGAVVVDYTGSSTTIGGRAGLGLELSEQAFTEAVLTLSDKTGGLRANGLGFYIGYRF